MDFIFLNTLNNSFKPTSKIKTRKKANKYPPLKIKKIDKGKIITEVKIRFCRLFIYSQNFFLPY